MNVAGYASLHNENGGLYEIAQGIWRVIRDCTMT